MKTKFFPHWLRLMAVFVLLLVVLAPAQPAGADGNWQYVGTPGFSVGEAGFTSLAFDNGTPYVAYEDRANDRKATVMRFDGATWVPVGAPGFSAGWASDLSLAFDNGTPYVAYVDWGYGERATVMKFDGATWVPIGAPGFSAGKVDYTSLALENGTPYVAYQDYENNLKATVMKFDGATWVPVGAPGFSAGAAFYTSLAFDNGTPFVAYLDLANDHKATVMKFDPDTATWAPVGAPGFSAGGAEHTFLAFDSGTPFIAYVDWVNDSKVTVMKFNGTDWVPVGAPGFSAGGAYYTSLAFDNGTPYVAYRDEANGNKATVMKFDGATWVPVGAPGFSAGRASDLSLALENGTPYVAYTDHGNGAKATVMRYEPNLVTTTTLASSANPSNLGDPVTFTAIVSPAPTGGTVAFKDGGTAISGCEAVSLNSGEAACATSALTPGTHVITAEYSGIAGYDGSTGTLSQEVNCQNAITVANADDSGPGSLRQAIADVCAGGTITFDDDYTITLASELVIAKDVTIDGVGHDVIVSGNNAVRVFYVNEGVTFNLQNLVVANGNAATNGGGIYNNRGTLNITNATFSSNAAAIDGGGMYNEEGDSALTNVTFTGNSSAEGSGGGIVNAHGTLTVTNSTFSNNSTDDYGGGIYNNYGTLTVTDSAFSDNSTDHGGGIFNEGTATVTNSTFSGNSSDQDGGGIDNEYGATLTVTNSTFSDNSTDYGGGIHNQGTATVTNSTFSANSAEGDGGGIINHGTLDVTNSTFSDNSASGKGGGIFNDGSLTVTDSTFSDNSASGDGGGIYSDRDGTLIVTNSDFSGNSASSDGGGIYSQGGTLTVADSTFSNNSATWDGGGIYNNETLTVTDSTFSGNNAGDDGGGLYANGSSIVTDSTFSDNTARYGGGINNVSTLNVTNSTFSGNSATYGGGIRNTWILNVTNSTFSGNGATDGGGIRNQGTATVANSLVASSASGGNCYRTIGGSDNLADDSTCGAGFTNSPSILLGALGDYGGSTQTFALLPGSAAIDATSSDCPATDQRGVSRPQGAHCDIGAFESQGFTLAISGGNNQSTVINTAFAEPLAVSVTANDVGVSVDGASVTFTPPDSGASAVISGSPATITGGAASVTAAANGTQGSYDVVASAAGAASVNFSLTNTGVPPSITDQPDDVTALVGDEVSFTSTADGTPTPTVQWQVSSDGGSTWNDIPGATEITLSFIAARDQNGNQYRAVFDNGIGDPVPSNAATLIVQDPRLALEKSASPAIYSYPGQVITYTYTVHNSGNVTLDGPFTVSDDKLGTFECDTASSLAPGASLACTKNYTIQAGDLNATNNATITNQATAAGKFGGNTVTSEAAQATVNQVAPTARVTWGNTTCAQFAAGTAPELTDAFYMVRWGRINSVSPGVFLYYSQITAPAANFQVVVQQSNAMGWPSIGLQTPQFALYDGNCNKLNVQGTVNSTEVTFQVRGATPGAVYYLSVKYTPRSLVGKAVSLPYPTVPYRFVTFLNGIPIISSWDGLNVRPK